MTDPQLAAGPQDPQGRSVPAPNQAPVIPPVQSEYDHELAIRNIRNSLYSTAQQINQQYLLHMAAQGQMQQYQAQKIQEATGGDMNQELALLENGMAVTNVRLPETRQAYQDWFADVEQRMAGTPGGIPENYPTLKDKYQDFTELAARFDATKSALKQQVQENLANYRSALRTPAEIVAPFAHEATMGAIPTPGTRVEDLGRSLRRVIDSIHPEVPKYDPGTRRDADPNARGGQVKPRDPRKDKRDTILRELAQQEATDQVRQAVAEHPEMRESDASLFMQKVSGYLGMALPMSAAEGLGVKAVQGMAGAAKTAVGKVAQHIAGAGLGFAGYGAMQPIAEEQQRRIESLPPDKRDTAERAARIDNAVTMALAAPLWIAGGALGSKIGSSLLPGTIGKSLGGGIGSGAVFPAAAEAQDTLKAKAIENVPSLRDMAEAQLIAKPELQGPVRQMIVSVEAGDWTSFKDGLMRYAKEAAPGMVAFGAIGAVHGISTSAQSKMHAHAKEIISYTEELAARARLEADKVAGADKELAEQLKQGVDQKVEEVRDAMAGEPTREGELATAVGPEEAAQKIAETKDIAETDLVSVQEKPEEGAPAKSEPAAGETLPGGQTSEEALPGGPTREERLLTKQAERAAPEEKPAIEAQVAEKKAKRRKRDVEEGIAPQEPQKPKTYQEAQAERIQRQAEARGRYEADPTDRKSMADYMEAKASGSALRYRDLARKSKDPEVQRAAEQKATEWEAFSGSTRAWRANKFRGAEPEMPFFSEDPARNAARAQRVEQFRAASATRGLVADASKVVPDSERAAAEHLAYLESDRAKIDKANETGAYRPGMVVEHEGEKRVVKSGDDHHLTFEDGGFASREAKPKIQSLKSESPPQEVEPTVEARSAIERAKERGDEPPAEAVQTINDAQRAAQHEFATDGTPETKPMRDMADIAVELNGFLKKLTGLKTDASPATTQSAMDFAKEQAAMEGLTAEQREFLGFVAEHGKVAGTKRRERYAAEMLYEYLAKKAGLPRDFENRSFGSITNDLEVSLRATQRLVRETKQMERYHEWAAQNAQHLEGPWAIAARYYGPGREVLRAIADTESGRLGKQSGMVNVNLINFPLWPVHALTGGWRFWQRFRADNFRTMMEQMSRQPDAERKGWAQKLLNGFFAMPAGWAGHIATKGIKSISEGRAQLDAVVKDFFDDISGVLAKKHVPEGSEQDRAIFKILDGDKAVRKATEDAAAAGDAGAKDTLERADKVRDWLDGVRKAITEFHPKARALRDAIEFAQNDVMQLNAARDAARAELAETHKKIAGHGELSRANRELMETKMTARHLYGGLKNPKSTGEPIRKPKPGMKVESYQDLLQRSIELSRKRAQLHQSAAIPLPETSRGRINGITRKLGEVRNHLKFVTSELAAFQDSFGIRDYIKHSAEFELVSQGTRAIYKEVGAGISSYEARRKVYADITKRRADKLRDKGLVQESVARAMWHYVHSAVPYLYRSRFLAEIDHSLYGRVERLTPGEIVRGKRTGIFGDKEVAVLGVHAQRDVAYKTKRGEERVRPAFDRSKLTKEQIAQRKAEREAARIAKAAGMEPPPGAQTNEVVLLWDGKLSETPSKAQLADERWVSKHLQSDNNPAGGLISVPKKLAFELLRAHKGGWWELADKARQGDMIAYIDRVTGGLGDLQGNPFGRDHGALWRSAEKTLRMLTSATSAMLLGGQLHSAMNNILGATFVNHFFLGGPMHGRAIKASGMLIGKLAKQKIQAAKEAVTRKGAEHIPEVTSDPHKLSLSSTWDKEVRTPAEQLAKLSPEKRVERQIIEDGLVALHQSGILGSNHANPHFGWSSAQKRFGRIERPRALRGEWRGAPKKARFNEQGGLELIEPTLSEHVGQFADNIRAQVQTPLNLLKGAWWSAFQASEIYTRAPAFLHGYYSARDAGRTHSQALADGLAMTHQLQMVYNQASKSPFLNSTMGMVLGNLSQWTIGFSGRLAALPMRKKLSFAASSMAMIVMFHRLFGLDVTDVFGTRVGNIPLVGDKLESYMLGLGISTKDDPQGLKHKGLLYDLLGLRHVPIPFPMPTQPGPLVGAMAEAVKGIWETAQGNGELAAEHLRRAKENLLPSTSTLGKQIDKAWGANNIAQSDGTFLYHPAGSSAGTQILRHAGWAQWWLQQLPGSDALAAEQWQSAHLAMMRGAYARQKSKELTELGMEWAGAFREREVNPAARADEANLRGKIQGMAKDLGRELTPADWKGWHERAEFERTTDSRLRGVLAAPSKEAKGRELAALLRDEHYPLSKERAFELLRKVGGKEGFGSWVSASDMDPKVRQEVQEAWALRKESWGK